MKFLILTTLTALLLSGCSSYVGKMHREFDRADGKRRKPRKHGDQFDFYRKNARAPKNGLVSSSNNKVLLPQVKRNYQSEKRIKADDLNDNGSAGSLWVGGGDDNFLFTDNTKKSSGDIVLIDVESRLKNEITAELKRAFPEKKKLKKKSDKEAAAGDAKTAEAPAATPAASQDGNKDQVFDRISSIVIEEINKDHLLLRGRKFLLFKNKKRLVEVQALVPRREITDADTVSSSGIIESTVNVIR
ncbi:MAG: hypothetical protein CME70_07950 [Halobacteriovorax sp.]|nr:hypothetical protein [Halobacteriovorax sp.]|tara:strand:+ start:248788 stop:249522 length:735 start_codon:yes stop_codon:yes gene_type:complete